MAPELSVVTPIKPQPNPQPNSQHPEPIAYRDLGDPGLYLNRELSFLQFNWRVLQQALDESLPLLERLKFIFICSSNLDEFFEVRVSDMVRRTELPGSHRGADGMAPHEVLERIADFTHQLVDEQYRIFNDVLMPALADSNIHFIRRKQWTEAQAHWIKRYFHHEVVPVISPIGLDLAHPFPRLVNKSLHFIISLEGKDAFGRDSSYAVIHMPRSLPRLIRLPNEQAPGGDSFVFLSSVIHAHAAELFPGMTIKGVYQFRLTRDSDLDVDEEGVEDLANALKNELLSRHFGTAVRLEVSDKCPDRVVKFLLQKCNLTERELYRVNGPVNLNRLMTITSLVERPDLCFRPMVPRIAPAVLQHHNHLFEAIAERDILLHHPFESFETVVEFVRQAAADPDVLAIKQTLYRTGKNSDMARALIDAARNGKEVTAVVELRARFDEQDNIDLASRLQEAGVLVVYGVVGHKTHAKMTLVVRREKRKLRRYVHLGTGNYHAANAKLYTDVSLLTAEPDLCEDVHKVFQQLTGMGKTLEMKRILQAPFTLQSELLKLIEREADHARAGKPAKILAKMNSLTESSMIRALYAASQAGVKIELIVRGVCCLKPGVPGVSDNIRVRSIIGRFLEHSRVYWFRNGHHEQIYASSADWMDRNLHHRVEVCFPILDKALARRLKHETLVNYLQDNSQAWLLQHDGSYRKAKPGKKQAYRAQRALLQALADES
ncbi:polyphosphate kinase 1 [Permianibacter sp. IMCC34836]|uniref:polyphosphate kinase 1 n=1 Tax=Permianibacter fluminis TaxID=2738515 RepID=UPI001556FF30|nr:polyphosphate kinase 1 [Permianibacter fluminis]NQD36078.1 polyphosphate kinase 1 [Permianibacter fluminis]